MKNLSLFWLVVILASLLLFGVRKGFPYAVPAYNPVIAADDYYSIRPKLTVIQGGKLDPVAPIKIASSAGFSSTPGLVAANVGIADASFYLATGKSPAMVLQAAAASALDHVIIPGYQAFSAQFVSPESFPSSVGQMVGHELGIGVAVGDFVDYVRNASGSAYDSLKASIVGATSGSIFDPFVNGDIIILPIGAKIITSNWLYWAALPANITQANLQNAGYTSLGKTDSDGSRYYYGSSKVYKFTLEPYSVGYNKMYYVSFLAAPVGSSENPPVPGAVDYPLLSPALNDWLALNPQAAADALRGMDQSKVGVTSQTVPSTVPSPVTPAINQQQVADFYQSNVSNIANNNLTNITETTTSTQIAQGEAALEVAKAQAAEIPKTISASGDSALPDANVYDPEVEQPDEEDFVDAVHSFLDSGLPVLSFIEASGLSASGSSTLSFNAYGKDVSIDFAKHSGVLSTMGILLTGVSMVFAFLIIIRS